MTSFVLLLTVVPILWQDPGVVEQKDLRLPARAVMPPKEPFQFLKEDLSGNSPKVLVQDANQTRWLVKGGPEGRSEAFVTRVVSAVGYFANAVCFLPQGRIEGVKGPLQRASGFIMPDGSFTYAAFYHRDSAARFTRDPPWNWLESPFAGTRELKGLKILVMLVSNWDNKDARDERLGPNTGVLEIPDGSVQRQHYFVDDWGQSMGAWGSSWSGVFGFLGGRSNWNCADYRRQTPRFIREVRGKQVVFGYSGQHTADFGSDITPEDVAWLMGFLGKLSDRQIHDALKVSGATIEEESCFAGELRQRLISLQRAASTIRQPIR